MDIEKELKEIKELASNNSKAIEEHNNKFQEQNQRILTNFESIQNNSIALDILKDFKQEIKQLHNEKERQYGIVKNLYRIIVLLVIAIIILGLYHFIG